GFTRLSGGKGSHRKFVHPKFPGFVLISGHDGDDAQHYQEKHVRTGRATGKIMRTQDRYLSFVRWSEDHQAYIGYCPDLFPAGGICHGKTPVEAFTALCDIMDATVSTAAAQG